MQQVIFSLFLVTVFSLTSITMAQRPGDEKLRNSTVERGLEELLAAIDTADNGNTNTIFYRGMMGGGAETHSVFLQIISDDRVRKIYSLLDSMPRDQAAAVVAKSYNESLSKLKRVVRTGKGDLALRYGLHAKLWLSYQFETRKDFNRRFSDWNDWYTDYLANEKYLANKTQPVPTLWAKSSFARSSSPELLMYLNLALIDQVKNGKLDDQSEYAQMLKGSGFDGPLSQSYFMLPILPFDAELDPTKSKDVEPFLTLPVFTYWHALDSLDIEQRIELISKVRRSVLDPKSRFESALDDLAFYLLSLGGTIDLEDLEANLKQLQRMKPKNGTVIAFLGSSCEKRLVQGWYAERPPTKNQLFRTIDRLLGSTPPDERDEWEANIQELRAWIAEIPETGIEVKEQKVMKWPASETVGRDADRNSELDTAKLRIRLVLRKTRAFEGTMKENDEDPQSKVPDRTKR